MADWIIDSSRTWQLPAKRLQTEPDPILRRNLEVLIKHMKNEVTAQYGPLMETVSEQAHYHARNSDEEFMSPKGKENIEAFYRTTFESGAWPVELAMDSLVVDKKTIVTEGVMRLAYSGNLLTMMGIDADDKEARYLFETRMVVLWPIDDAGLILGEDSYAAGDGLAGILERKLKDSDIRPMAEVIALANA